MTIQDARDRAEEAVGRKLSEDEFSEVLWYTRHKAKVNGHGEDYVPLLLYDEIKNHCFRARVNAITHEFLAIIANFGERREENVRPVPEFPVS